MIDIKLLKTHMYDVIGALHEVHKELGPGINEVCYQEGLAIELKERNIAFSKEVSFHPKCHNKILGSTYRVDFICKQNIVIECKAVTFLSDNHRAQLFNYMRLLEYPCGILVNFATRYAEIERYFYDKDLKKIVTTEGKPFIF